MSSLQDYSKSIFYYIQLINKWKIQFAIITIIAITAATVFSSSYFIKPKYKSFAILYPSNITPYGEESTTEQMIQLLESADIRNAIIKKFDLATRYEIDTTAKAGMAALISVYESNVSINKTQYESVDITVFDSDPKTACAMANEIIHLVNLKARQLQRDKTREVMVVETNQLNLKRHQLDSLESSLLELRVKYQILDYNAQAKEVVKGYVKVLSSGKGSGNLKDIDVMMKNMEEKGGEYYRNIGVYNSVLAAYNTVKIEYDNVWKDMNKELTYTNVVTHPFPSDKKTYPIRWLIVLTSVISANLFLYIIIIARDIRKKLIQ